ncbi:Wzz/FepE/Etk N-terminal domain-containing protein [Kribbella sp. NPDC058245]|uniref:Wzz/FepE/Etk N-terminal domain-containing protein n=1 Tax=Kribbella sp. NPDC058245 TaxID=3346399 RepID=UPI0036ED12DA
MTNQQFQERTSPASTWDDQDGLFDGEHSAAYPPDSLVTFRFLRDALVRHRWVWLLLAVLGLVGGVAAQFGLPSAHSATARILVTTREGEDPAKAMATEVSLATTRTVASRVIDSLKLTDTPDVLLKRYTVVPVTSRILEIKAGAKSDVEATALASTIASTFLKFRREQIALQDVPLRRDLTAAQNEATLARQGVVAAGDDPVEPKRPGSPEMTRLNAAQDKVKFVQQQLLDSTTIASKMNSSRLLDAPAPVLTSAKKMLVLKAGTGLIAGLFLGLGFVVVRALISDRLWKRQDIASALGARVRLSTGRPPHRLLPFSRLLRPTQSKHRGIQLLTQHLSTRIVWAERPSPSMAVISVDDVRTCALAVASLAVALADQGKNVLVADLTGQRALATKLGVTEPGTHDSALNGEGRMISVHLPAKDALLPEGCYLRIGDTNRPSGSGDVQLDAAWEDADLVLTLATLSPALGAEHLGSWASRAAVVATAGRSSATTLKATGDMLRLAGLEIDTAIVLHADKTDEGVGVTEAETADVTADVGMFSR